MLEAILEPISYNKQELSMERVRKMLALIMLRYYSVFELAMDKYMAATGDTLENYTRCIETSEMWCDMMMIGMYTHMHNQNDTQSECK